MQTQFQKILKQVRDGKPASMTFEATGIVYVRNFYPAERLLLLDISPSHCAGTEVTWALQ